MSFTVEVAVTFSEDSNGVFDVCVGCTPGFDLTSTVDVLWLCAPRGGLLCGRVDDETEAVRWVAREDALDFVTWDVFRISLDMNTGLGGVRGVNSKNNGSSGAPDGFEEVFGDGPVNKVGCGHCWSSRIA